MPHCVLCCAALSHAVCAVVCHIVCCAVPRSAMLCVLCCTMLCVLWCARLYLKVQRLFREKAEQDVAAVEAHVHALLGHVGREAGSISRDTIRLYCKNARNLRLVRYGCNAYSFNYGEKGCSSRV